MSLKVGMKMLYCKTHGDKKSEEVVEIVSVQSEAEGGGVTIFIPSLKRERDTEATRLTPIVEKKATLENFFGKPKLELPARPESNEWNGITVRRYTHGELPPGHDHASIGHQWMARPIGKDLYAETDNLHQADEVLLDNQRLLFNQLNSLKESLKVLSLKEKKPVTEDSLALAAEIAELRTMNTRLLMNQQEMVKEMRQMKAEMLALRQGQSIPEAIAVEVMRNPIIAFGSKI